MSRLFWGIAFGAASAYMLDPQQGRRRRELLRARLARGVRDSGGTGGLAAALFLYGLARGGIGGLGAIVLGSAVLARNAANAPARERVAERVSP